jgi:hypothetical protein
VSSDFFFFLGSQIGFTTLDALGVLGVFDSLGTTDRAFFFDPIVDLIGLTPNILGAFFFTITP